MTKILSLGDACIDHYLAPVDRRFIGGSALNCAVHLKEAGADAAFLGAVGSDDEGRAVLDALTRRGIDVSRCQIRPGQTASVAVRLEPGGERRFLHELRVAGPRLRLDPADLEYARGFDLVHTNWRGGVEGHLPALRAAGSRVSMDYGDRCGREFIDATLASVDIAFVSISSGERDGAETVIRDLHARGPSVAVAMLGESGALAFDGRLHTQPAVPVDAVDTLGAGDSFIAAFLAGWSAEKTVEECLPAATFAAARTCTYFGGWPDAPLVEPNSF